ncbi:hypothetical protein BU15DRAFT_66330 [Melanogaster broomeanus]|nr:hypothetical protein BU15DRAFT_66330 [Melanogaster broomeanus]
MKSKNSPWSIVPQFFRKVIHSLMASPTEIAGLFTSPLSPRPIILPVDIWSATLNINAANASRCFVKEVVHYKHSGGKEHEFLHFTVSHPEGSWLAFVFTDRTTKKHSGNGGSSLSNKAAVLSNPSPSSSSSSSHSSPLVPACDTIYVATDHSAALEELRGTFFNNKHETIRTLTFDTGPSVMELATLLTVTSHHAPSYSLCQNQCYWFAHTIYEALRQLFPHHRERIDSGRRGTCHYLPVSMADSHKDVCAAYDEKKAALLASANEERERYATALRAERQEGREEGREEGRAEERAALERERAALAAWEQELLRVKEELALQSRGAAAN